ncbi:patatin-like phospholipase family protein [Micropruina sp.]|uniref:patatin-like phospholipase family protein n=1 Tax=Micropruina sp. TaxID=2737536 RepID=UPI0039E62965
MSGSGSADAETDPSPRRCVVLGGGGLSGIGWLRGVLDELPDVLHTADRVVGTSAGALLAARLLGGGDADDLRLLVNELAGVRVSLAAASRLLAAQVAPSRRHALQWLGCRAVRPVALGEAAFVDLVGRAIGRTAWPASLIVVAVDGHSGRPAYFTRRSGVPLAPAVAASCAVPGVFPAVHIESRPYLDGGLRTPANADLATGCDRTLVLAPQPRSVRSLRRPGHQAQRLRAGGAEVVLVQDESFPAHSMAVNGLPAARERGRRAGRASAAEVRELWGW